MSTSYMPDEKFYRRRLAQRQQRGNYARGFYYVSILVGIVALILLFGNVINSAFGSIAVRVQVDPDSLSGDGRALEELSAAELAALLAQYVPNRMAVLVRDNLSQVPNEEYTASILEDVFPNGSYPEGYAETSINEIRALEAQQAANVLAEFLGLNLDRTRIETLVIEEIVKLEVIDAWSLSDTLFNSQATSQEVSRLEELDILIPEREQQLAELQTRLTELKADSAATEEQINTAQQETTLIEASIGSLNVERDSLIYNNIDLAMQRAYPDAELTQGYSWLNGRFLQATMSSVPAQAGIRTAILGSLVTIVIVILFALPVGVATAIYLEEYAGRSFINAVIETNVRNLAGVPSIIYGMLGLAIFVRTFAPLTSGILFGFNTTVPSDFRISGAIESVVAVDILLNDDGDYAGIADGSPLTEEQIVALMGAFRTYGTAGFNNMRGEVTTDTAVNAVLNALQIPATVSIPSGVTPDQLTAEMVILPENAPIAFDTFQGLAVALKQIGSFTVSGRTVVSAALTLGLLILPVIIINAQEALRAVPRTLREASYGLGATKWQTIWRTVLPAAIPGIMTGTILSVSRAIGETAPLIVVGASTFLLTDPSSPFSRFTVLPIQIYNWTSRPQEQYQFIAAAAIIMLLGLVLTMNAAAIFLRNRFSVRY